MASFFVDADIEYAFQEYANMYCQAEKALKFTEIHTLQGITIAAVNQLRYAGQHLARILLLSDKEKILHEIETGKNHAKRAIYEAYDAAILFYLKQFKQFNEEFKAIPITPSYPRYTEDKARLHTLMSDIAAEDRENGEEYIEQKKQQLIIVREIVNQCDSAREELNKQKRAKRTSAMRFFVTFAIAFMGLLIALATFFWGSAAH